jgi:hypothetical protein
MILSPKEKAKELYSKFQDSIIGLEGYEWWESGKYCALIAVEFAKENPLNIDYNIYLDEVKKEIELL